MAQVTVEPYYGGALTSNYISSGSSQSDGRPALQGYVGANFGSFYAGAWASTVDFGDDSDDRIELDLYVGYGNSLGDLEYYLTYTRYIYDESGDCCGELAIGADYAIEGFGSIGGEAAYDPVFDTGSLEARGRYDFAEAWSVDGTAGTDAGTLELDRGDKFYWDLGVTRSLSEVAYLDVRYHNSNDDPARLAITVGADF